jgi:hypothetical protein
MRQAALPRGQAAMKRALTSLNGFTPHRVAPSSTGHEKGREIPAFSVDD